MIDTATTPALWQLELNRTFDAPVALVYEAFTKPELWKRWFPPRGFEMKIAHMDFRVGGTFDASFHGHGMDPEFSGTYRVIEPEQRLAWESCFPDGPPDQMLTTVVFTARGEQTEVAVTQAVYHWSPIAEQAVKGAREGWGQSLDKLGEYLASV